MAGFTSFLRTRWGLHKDRESTLHHAQDACVIAAATPALDQAGQATTTASAKRLEILPGGGAIVDVTTGEIKKDANSALSGTLVTLPG